VADPATSGYQPVIGPMTLEFPALVIPTAPPAAAEAAPAAVPEPEPLLPPAPAAEPAPGAAPTFEMAFEPIVGPRTLEFPALGRETIEAPAIELVATEPPAARGQDLPPPAQELPALELDLPEPDDPRTEALRLAQVAEAATDSSSRAAAWLASAQAARRAGAAPRELRLAVDLAREAEPDAPEPLAALAELELEQGEPVAAARAYLAVSIRTEGPAAADAALVAARIFLEQGLLPETVRALRAAMLGDSACVPPPLFQAAEALAAGALTPAAGLLAQVEPGQLKGTAHAIHERLRSLLEQPMAEPVAEPAPEAALALPEEPVALPQEPEPVASPVEPPLEPPGRQVDFGAEVEAAFGEVLDPTPAPAPAEPAAPVAELELELEPPPAAGEADPVLAQLRAEATAASGGERASALERLAGVLERRGDTGAAADALFEALSADADRELTWGWLDSLVSGDPARQARVAELRETASAAAPALAEALEQALAAARRDPTDVDCLLQVAGLASRIAGAASPSERERLAERARLAWSIAAFVAPQRAGAPEAPPLAAALSESARDRVALPETIGPLGKLLSMLAPHLELLFPADLGRHRVGVADRLLAPRAPEIGEPLEAAATLLSARPHAAFLTDRPGAQVEIENTRPPALIIPSAVALLPLGARRFLAVRALDQLARGWALVGRFSPRDIGILLELACRFAGGQPPALGLPAARAGAFLSALAQGVPPVLAAQVTSLGPAAAAELATAELGTLASALQRTSARVALLATGDPAGAFAALVADDPKLQALGAAEAIELPALRELASLALSEPFLDLRLAVVR
jgi:hypothetical protein